MWGIALIKVSTRFQPLNTCTAQKPLLCSKLELSYVSRSSCSKSNSKGFTINFRGMSITSAEPIADS